MIEYDSRKLCESCFSEIGEYPCEKCGFTGAPNEYNFISLPQGVVLAERYRVGKMIKRGGFGITYVCFDLETGRRLALKEYFPAHLATRSSNKLTLVSTSGDELFRDGCENFYNEARTIYQFSDNPRIVSVYQFFYANNTAYYVMEYLEGCDLGEYVKKKGGKLQIEEAVHIVKETAKALAVIHKASFLHRDINPNNIFVCNDGRIKLIDFGAARQYIARQSQSLDSVIMEGFTASEQYSRHGNYGPHTDLYALGATMYYIICGRIPEASVDRMSGSMMGYPAEITQNKKIHMIIRKCMELEPKNRYQNAQALLNDLENDKNLWETYKKPLIIFCLCALLLGGGVIAGIMISSANNDYGNSKETIKEIEIVSDETEGTETTEEIETTKETESEEGTETEEEKTEIHGIKLSQKELKLTEGSKMTLAVEVEASGNASFKVEWSSANKQIAVVDNDGMVVATGVGSTTITAKVGDLQAQCSVTVEKETVVASKILLSEEELVIKPNESKNLKWDFWVGELVPSDVFQQDVTWKSSNKDVVSVSGGKITALKPGEATITATTLNNVSATCLVKVPGITDIKVDEGDLTLNSGEQHTYTIKIASFFPDLISTSDKAITLNSSDTNVVSVNGHTITAKNTGIATLTFTSSNGVKITRKVTVKEVVVTGISLNNTSLSISKGQASVLTANVAPSNTTNHAVTWSSSNTNVVTVSNGKITAVGVGTATITAKCGEYSATCTVTVKSSEVAVTEVTLDMTSVSLNERESVTLTARVAPNDATNKEVKWTSSDTNVVTVSNGKVTAVGAGTATVTAEVGEFTTKCTITVKQNEISKALALFESRSYKNAVKLFKEMAEQGNADAQYYYGYCLYNGYGVNVNWPEAVSWLTKAMEQGHIDALVLMAHCYCNGAGVNRNTQKAFEMYSKAAELGDICAIMSLGRCYMEGVGVNVDQSKANKIFSDNIGKLIEYANKGNAEAQNTLAIMYEYGYGVEKNGAEAEKWYKKAVAQDYTTANINLAYYYLSNENYKSAYEYAKISADKKSPIGQYVLAVCCYNGYDEEGSTIYLIIESALSGYMLAQEQLGELYIYGFDGVQSYTMALEWFEKAASDHGSAIAQNWIGRFYAEGWDGVVEKNYEIAVSWYRKAADQGYDIAQWNLAMCYLDGLGVTKSEEMAIKYLELAAAQGMEDAIEWLKENR